MGDYSANQYMSYDDVSGDLVINGSVNGLLDSYTAGESIAAGAVVAKNTVSDEVENIVVSTLLETETETESTFSAGTTTYIKSCYCAKDKIAIIYRTSTDSLGYIVIATIAVDKTITWGSPVSLGNDISRTDIKYMSDDKIVMIYVNVTDSKTYTRVASVSGTVPTLGTAKEIYAGVSTSNAIAVIDTDKIIGAYAEAVTNHGYVACATVSGTTISNFGSTVEILTTGTGDAVRAIAVAKCSTDKAVVFCGNDTDGKGDGALVTASGTVLTVYAEVEIDSAAADYFSADYITDGKVLVTWVNGATSFCSARVASVSGTTLSYPTATTAVNGTAGNYETGVAVINSTTAFVAYNENGATDGKYNKILIDGTTLTVRSQYNYNGGTNNIRYTAITKISPNNKFLIAYEDLVDANKGNASVYQDYNNTETTIGFANSTVTIGESVKVREKGVAGNQSGISIGSIYYLSNDGTISTTNTNGTRIGIGVSSTEVDTNIYRENDLLGYTTLSSNAATISVSNFIPKDNLKIVLHVVGFSAADYPTVQFNGDTASNYQWRMLSWNGATNGTNDADDTNIDLGDANSDGTGSQYLIIEIVNKTEYNKLVSMSGHGGDAALCLIWGNGVWENINSQIVTVTFSAASGNNFLAGTNMKVFGN
jgi:hypothetical protein